MYNWAQNLIGNWCISISGCNDDGIPGGYGYRYIYWYINKRSYHFEIRSFGQGSPPDQCNKLGCPRNTGKQVIYFMQVQLWIFKFSITQLTRIHYSDIIMSAMASQITSLTIVYLTVYSSADRSKHQSSASLAFVWGIHQWPVNSPHKWPVTRETFPFDNVIMNLFSHWLANSHFLIRLVIGCQFDGNPIRSDPTKICSTIHSPDFKDPKQKNKYLQRGVWDFECGVVLPRKMR